MKPIVLLAAFITLSVSALNAQTIDETYSKGVCEFSYCNYDKAFEQFLIAANQGHTTAQRMLGYCYRHGYGVQKNLELSKTWYKKAVDKGDEYAIECYNDLLEDEKYGHFFDGPNNIPSSGHSHCDDIDTQKIAATTESKEENNATLKDSTVIIELETISEMISKGEDISGKTITAVNSINFDFGSDKIKTESYTYLDNLLKVLKQTGAKINVKGHTDNVGTEAANLKLSRDRAKAVVNYLVKHGIDKNIITYEGFGSERPLSSNDTEEGRALNRRVEFELLKK